MKHLLAAALALISIPALAQDAQEKPSGQTPTPTSCVASARVMEIILHARFIDKKSMAQVAKALNADTDERLMGYIGVTYDIDPPPAGKNPSDYVTMLSDDFLKECLKEAKQTP